MEIIKVYSPVEDNDIRTNLNNSPIWKQAYHADEYKDAIKRKNYQNMFEYSIKFNGTKPIQVTNILKVSK